MAQYAQPISDQSTGNWQTTPIWSKIDGLTPDSAEVESPDNPTGGSDDTFKCKLGPILTPDSDAQTLTVRLKRTGSDELPASIALMEGGTPIAFTNVTPTTSYANYSLTLSQSEIDMIDDYTNLSVRVTAGGPPCPDCAFPIPALLKLVISSADIDCICAPGTEITMEWDDDDQLWRGTGPFGKCGRDVTFELDCDPSLRLNAFFSDGCCGGGCGPFGQLLDCDPFLFGGAFPVTESCCNNQGPFSTFAFDITG